MLQWGAPAQLAPSPMAAYTPTETRKRFLLRIAAKTMGAAGLLAVAVAFLSSLFSAEPHGAEPVIAELHELTPGALLVTEWERRRVLVLHRTPAMLRALEARDDALADPLSRRSRQPEAARNAHRSLRPEYFVAIAHGTDLGCELELLSPGDQRTGAGAPGGFRDRCRGSLYDLAGRVHKHQEAFRNLEIPPHRFLSDHRLQIGPH
jgi:ubiquinol-cytochrome c reductase iron-sulfur subunit